MIKGQYKPPYILKTPLSFPKYVLFVLSTTFFIVLFFTAQSGISSGRGDPPLLFSAAFFTFLAMFPVGFCSFIAYPVILLRMAPSKTRAFIEAVKGNFPGFMKRTFTYSDYNPSETGNASCLAYDGKNIIIMNDGQYVILGWNDIRKWGWELAGMQETTGGGIGNSLANKFSDISANAKAGQKSGFTISVTDINQPTLFFPTGLGDKTKKTCEKWMEIFNQINEGKLPIEKVAMK